MTKSQELEEKRGKLQNKLNTLDEVLPQVKEVEDKLQQIETKDNREETEGVIKWLQAQPLRGHSELVKKYAKENNINLTEADKILDIKINKYEIEGKGIPDLIKDMRKYRRTLKGDSKLDFTKAIDDVIDGYTDYLNKSIDKIYWVSKYQPVLKEMNCKSKDLEKLNKIKDEDTRRTIVDCLCKYWEDKQEIKELSINKDYAILYKSMANSKKQFKKMLKEKSVTLTPKQEIKKSIIDMVCENPGISARELHEGLPDKLHKKSSTHIIAKLAKEENITQVDGAYYKINDDIKKNIWAYTAAFIDSDGYITMDKNFNPRVGLIATGDRGKAFMLEMHKSLGCGRLHLDQKSPQDTRPVNRLNFYSQDDVRKLLVKCLPHFRMKKSNAELLLELIRIKKGFKKQSWYKERIEEIYKLMKWENHKDNKNYDFSQYGIDPTTVAKLHGNNKTSVMDELENIGTVVK